MRSVEATPVNTTHAFKDREEAILDAVDDILEDDEFGSAAAELPDDDDNFVYLEGPGVTYDTEEGPWIMPEAYSESNDTSDDEPTIVQYGRERLRGSKALQQKTREFAFKRISQASIVKAEIENGTASIKRPLLERKQKAEERKIKKYEQKARTSMFAFRREAFARKARWAKRRLNETVIKLSKHEHMFGVKNSESNKDEVKDRGEVYKVQKKRYLERKQELELKRSKLLERQILASERKRRREMQYSLHDSKLNEADRAILVEQIKQLPTMQTFQANLKNQLKNELRDRIAKTKNTVNNSSNRWRWESSDREI